MAQSYRDLTVWQKSFDLAHDVYLLTDKLPRTEQFGLISQMQRCAVSIPSNISEGQQRQSSKEFKHFLSIARGSAAELSTQLLLVQQIYIINTSALIDSVDEVQKMLYGLWAKL